MVDNYPEMVDGRSGKVDFIMVVFYRPGNSP